MIRIDIELTTEQQEALVVLGLTETQLTEDMEISANDRLEMLIHNAKEELVAGKTVTQIKSGLES